MKSGHQKLPFEEKKKGRKKATILVYRVLPKLIFERAKISPLCTMQEGRPKIGGQRSRVDSLLKHPNPKHSIPKRVKTPFLKGKEKKKEKLQSSQKVTKRYGSLRYTTFIMH